MHRMVRIHLFRHRDCLPDETFFNTDCLFYKQLKHSNRTDFQNDGTCEYCSALDYDTPCLAQTYTAFSYDKETAANHCAHYNGAAKKSQDCEKRNYQRLLYNSTSDLIDEHYS